MRSIVGKKDLTHVMKLPVSHKSRLVLLYTLYSKNIHESIYLVFSFSFFYSIFGKELSVYLIKSMLISRNTKLLRKMLARNMIFFSFFYGSDQEHFCGNLGVVKVTVTETRYKLQQP